MDTLATSFFVYTGPDSGSYEVRFEPVEAGEGEYADTVDSAGNRYFVFVGEDEGDFVPGRAITAASPGWEAGSTPKEATAMRTIVAATATRAPARSITKARFAWERAGASNR